MKRKLFPAVLLLIIILSGCGVWRNFTTYFNRYYMAKEEFDKAEAEVIASKTYLFEFKKDVPLSKVQEQLNKVVEMCSKIMQYNSKSGYVKDAIFITGKAFFYQNNFLKAERKFAEIMAFNDPDFYFPSNFWLGKTYLRLGEEEKGLKFLNQVIDSGKVEEETEFVNNALIDKISYFIYKKNYEQAVKYCDELIKICDDNGLAAEVSYEMGRVYVLMNDYKKALDAYLLVDEFSPTPLIEINSQIEIAKLRRITGDYDGSLELLSELKDNSKFLKFFNVIDLETGNVFYDLKEYDKAINIFTNVDTLNIKDPIGGVACFMKGKVFEDLSELDSAYVYYKKLMSRVRPTEYLDSALIKSKQLEIYKTNKEKLKKLAVQYKYNSDTLSFKIDLEDYFEKRKEDSLNIVYDNKSKYKNVLDAYLNTKYIKPVYEKKNVNDILLERYKTEFSMGEYFFAEKYIIDSAKYYFNKSLSQMPDSVRNARFYYSIGSFYSIAGEKEISDSLLNIVYEKYKFDPLANEAAKRLNKPQYIKDDDTAKIKFESLENLINKKEYSTLIPQLKKIFRDFPKSPYAAKSLYTIGWLYENEIKNADSMAVYYDTLIAKYPTSSYAKSAQDINTFIKAEKKKVEDEKKAEELKKQEALKKAKEDKKSEVPVDKKQQELKNDENTVISDSLKNQIKTRPKKILEESDSLRRKRDSLRVIER